MNDLSKLVIFSIDEQQYALPLSAVERILRVVQVTPLPEAPEIITGVINVQGRIIPVVNIRSLFGLPGREINLSDQLLIAHTPKNTLALLVETVGGVINYPEKEVVNIGNVLPGIEHIKGMIRLGEDIVQILDLDTILSFGEIKSLDVVTKGIQGGGK